MYARLAIIDNVPTSVVETNLIYLESTAYIGDKTKPPRYGS